MEWKVTLHKRGAYTMQHPPSVKRMSHHQPLSRPSSQSLPWVAGISLFAVVSLDAQGRPAPPLEPLRAMSAAIEQIASRASPSVVEVTTSGYVISTDDVNNKGGKVISRERAFGAGVILSADGYIITNAHVVDGAQRVRVRLSSDSAGGQVARFLRGETGRAVDARIVGVDRDLDLALLKVSATGLRPMPLGDYQNIRQGQLVFVVGAPEGFTNSVTMGLVSAVARQPDPDDPMTYIQTDAAINPGNSGGALVNVDGELVGVTTFIVSKSGGSEGLGFAIPSSVVAAVYPELRTYGHVRRGVMGVEVQANSPDLAAGLRLAQTTGVLVADVTPKSPAEAAGLYAGDIVIAIDGRPTQTVAAFGVEMSTHKPGDSASVRILRDTSTLTVRMRLIEQADRPKRLIDVASPRSNSIPLLGIVGVDLTEQTAGLVDDLRVVSGVLVAARMEESQYADNPLLAGDVIHGMDGVEVRSRADLLPRLRDARQRTRVVLQIERDGSMRYVVMRFE